MIDGELVSRLRREGGSLMFTVPSRALERLAWKQGDIIVVRVSGESLHCRRLPIESVIEAIARAFPEESD